MPTTRLYSFLRLPKKKSKTSKTRETKMAVVEFHLLDDLEMMDKQTLTPIFQTVPGEFAWLMEPRISGNFQFDEQREILVVHKKETVRVTGFRKDSKWYCLESQLQINMNQPAQNTRILSQKN